MIEWNKIKYLDCLDEDEGLPSLPDNSIDLCFTDTPYGVNYIGSDHKEDVLYEDKKILDFKWFDQVLRICRGLIFTCGVPYLYECVKYKKPKNLLRFVYYRNSGKRIHYDILLTYGTISRLMYMRDVIEVPRAKFSGFLHPSPKSIQLWTYILEKLRPKSVIDPFIGSGTTAEVCIRLGIPYIGYEINPIYKQDMDLRKNRGMYSINSSRNLNNWF
ncbi:hypothetical protein LCGC14_2054720 [marine sediment metagenome]|uniref:DNA methylase N-4/N-6 domain-containing protein n=1 Tax=marine sediment metagenome TaxID=412755 RepID=A0A0F9H1E1_9ZZZZ